MSKSASGLGGQVSVGTRKFLGFPLEGFGLFTSLLLAASSGFFTFFLVTALSIFGLLFWNGVLGHKVNYANSYLFFGFPAAVVVWAIALIVFGTLWIRARIGYAADSGAGTR
jgi:hypothetical protein